MKIAFITNLPSHFHTQLFETIARNYDADFFFFSDGSEKWVEKKNLLKLGNYSGTYVHGIRLTSRLRINIELVARLLRGKYEVFIQSINGRFELIATFILAKLLRKPFILWTNLWFHPNTLFHKISFPIVGYIYRHSDAIVAYGYHVKDYLVKLGVDEQRISYSWNVTNNELFNKEVPEEVLEQLRGKYNLNGRSLLLFVGRHADGKGLQYLLEAFRDLPPELNASLLLIGRGEKKEALMEYAKHNAIQHIYFSDYVSNEELVKYFALADVFVLPSVTTRDFKESWGIVLNEAMNQGCPVIATDAVGAAMGGLVCEGKNGFVVPERNSKELRNAIVRMLSNRAELLKMKEYTREAIKEWDHDKSFKGFQEAIDRVTGRSKKEKET
jgi:glycosyltransferase involved in cell wall biosynthesis